MPIQKNQRFELEITELSEKGLGIGLYEGQRILVPFTAIGDHVLVHVTKASRSASRSSYGKCLEILNASKDRVDPLCAVFGRCGGCQLQHLSPDAQKRFKQSSLEQRLTQAGISFPSISYKQSPTDYGYRNKLQFSVSKDTQGQYQIGLSAPRSQRIVDTKSCEIQDPLHNQVLAVFRDFLQRYQPPVFNDDTGESGIAHLFLRLGEGVGEGRELMLGLVANHDLEDYHEDFIAAMTRIPELKSLFLVFNKAPKWTVLVGEQRLLWGVPQIRTQTEGIESSLSLSSFYQANTQGIGVLWESVKSALSATGEERLLELYSGAGALTLFLAPDYKEIIGLELSEDAVSDANASLQRLQSRDLESSDCDYSHLSFYQGRAEDFLADLEVSPDVILCDPPRKGLGRAVIDSIITVAADKLLYVSCSPETLVRDLSILLSAGYQISSLEILDLFPQSYHMEIILSLRNINSLFRT